MSSKDVCSPWPWKCSPSELSEVLKKLEAGETLQEEPPPRRSDILERSVEEGYYARPVPAQLPQVR